MRIYCSCSLIRLTLTFAKSVGWLLAKIIILGSLCKLLIKFSFCISARSSTWVYLWNWALFNWLLVVQITVFATILDFVLLCLLPKTTVALLLGLIVILVTILMMGFSHVSFDKVFLAITFMLSYLLHLVVDGLPLFIVQLPSTSFLFFLVCCFYCHFQYLVFSLILVLILFKRWSLWNYLLVMHRRKLGVQLWWCSSGIALLGILLFLNASIVCIFPIG